MTACVRRSCKSLPLNRRVQPSRKAWTGAAMRYRRGKEPHAPASIRGAASTGRLRRGRICGQAGMQPLRDMRAGRPTGTLVVVGSWAGVQGTLAGAAGTRKGSAKPLTSRVPCASSFAIVIGGWEHLTDVVPFWGRCGAERGQLRGASISINPRF